MPSCRRALLLAEKACLTEEIGQRFEACLVGLVERAGACNDENIARLMHVSKQYPAHFPQRPPGAVPSHRVAEGLAGDHRETGAGRNAFLLSSSTRVEHGHRGMEAPSLAKDAPDVPLSV